MSAHVVHVCSFSSLDDLSKKDRRDQSKVLRVLSKVKRFSSFEVDDALAPAMTALFQLKLIRDVGGQYPWVDIELTDAGWDALCECEMDGDRRAYCASCKAREEQGS